MTLSLVDAFFALLVGMGPVKALVTYLAATKAASAELQRAVARKMVVTAVAVAVVIELIAVVLMQLLHFTIPALRIAGGLILLILALRMVLEAPQHSEDAAVSDAQLMGMAVFPLAVPLLLNPVGIVTLSIFSVEVTELLPFLAIMAMIATIGLLDYVILVSAHRLDRVLTRERILILEKLLGIFLSALAVQLVIDGLAEFGIVTLATGH